ncbi:glycoside hydrolase family 13 protein [Halapricum hydrolyticum]|uniref:Alpha-glucosidase n=1 Tax=Halapricum hydrolyticum TaxID=2979991 RepID=A0AAE3LE26_9EURY|nr:alpha-glucosidase [Halapricum hydrolyticum]MCU4716980.1 alpha-glucosidase [Halapricum hydrolyticum]MCU4725415.1 alpha-glucosidase [Halapricum hydrolyticum]
MCASRAGTIGDGEQAWWKEAVVYEIYPQSFNDSDGDGIGDIPGIIEKADYLDELGIDVVWLTPPYDSPHADNGYDVRDYRSILDEFGDMDDFERLLEELHDRDIRLILDMVLNHTSDEHEWFQKSRREEDGYEDFYHWVEGDPDEPPNNWTSGFGGSAWAYDEVREAWYLHLFHEKQPDLNWRNPEVRQSMYDVVEFWLEKGIDGFRFDVFNVMSKPEGYPDGDSEGGWVGMEHFSDGPRIHEYIGDLYDEVLSEYDVMTVGEGMDITPRAAKRYCGPSGDGLNMVYHYDHTLLDYGEDGWWDVVDWEVSEIREALTKWVHQLEVTDAWNTVYLGTHDTPRIASRFGNDDRYRYESATMLGTLLLTFPATPFCFQGDEIGMTNYPWSSREEMRDADATNRVEMAFEEGRAEGFSDVQDVVRYRSRDNARTPVQWSDDDMAGFTDGEPWIPINPNSEDINVADQRDRAESVLAYYQELIELRHSEDPLVYGVYDLLAEDHPRVWAFARSLDDETLLVALNWAGRTSRVDLSEAGSVESVLACNYDDPGTDLGSLALRPYEARVYRLE